LRKAGRKRRTAESRGMKREMKEKYKENGKRKQRDEEDIHGNKENEERK
jgi:hypothetical protein